MLGYDWVRLHAALNDLPTALLLAAEEGITTTRSRAAWRRFPRRPRACASRPWRAPTAPAPGSVPARRAAICTLLVAFAACATGGLRPRYGARPDARALDVPDSADRIVTVLETRARAFGLGIVRSVPREGYLETAWYDLGARAPTGPPFENLDRIVKLRFFADPWQGKTRVLAECVWRIAWDPSTPERDLERMVPADHPGRALLDSVLVAIKPDSVRPPPLRP